MSCELGTDEVHHELLEVDATQLAPAELLELRDRLALHVLELEALRRLRRRAVSDGSAEAAAIDWRRSV